jgi:L-lactate dehydrogenase complex protein LldG
MSTARERILGRIRVACPSARLPQAGSEHPGRFTPLSDTPADHEALAASFTRELEQLGGRAHRAASADAAREALRELVAGYAPRKVLAWEDRWILPGVKDALIAAGIDVIAQQVPQDGAGREARLTDHEQCGVGITGADFGLAETGSLVLTSGPGRGRLASLLPIAHIAVLPVARLVWSIADVLSGRTDGSESPQGGAVSASSHPGDLVSRGSNLVVITGPSRTADIEMSLTRGVHGPRDVHVILVGEPESPVRPSE